MRLESLRVYRPAPGKDVGREHAANNVAQMRDIVNVWQSGSNEDIPLALFGQDLFLVLAHDRVR